MVSIWKNYYREIMKLLTQTEYAKLRGVSQPYINKLIKQGKLHTESSGRIDPERANLELESSTGAYKEPAQSYQPAPKADKIPVKKSQPIPEIKQNRPRTVNNDAQLPENTGRKLSYYEARAANEIIKAKIHKVEYDKLIGTVVLIDEVVKELFETDRIIRDKIQDMPKRICPGLPCSDDVRFAVEQHMKIEIQSILGSISHAVSP